MSGRIAVVEDEPDLLELLRQTLEDEGYVVTPLRDPRAIRSFESELEPDLLLLDMSLPGMTGVELARQLRSTGYDGTPMIAMSASSLMVRIASESGLFQDILVKPFDLYSLVASIGRYVA
jgi:CheY-like chemotaxis protein